MGLLCFPPFFSCRVGMEAQHAAPLLAFTQLNGELNTLCNPAFINFQFSIFNFQLFRPNGGGVKRSTERSVKKSRLFERSEFSEILA